MWHRVYGIMEEYIPFVFFSVIFVLMVFGVVTRYLFHTSYPWNIELCRYSFVWLTFAGAAYLRRENAHIRIEFVINYLNRKLPPWGRMVIWLFNEILTIGFLIALIYLGFILANKTWRFKSQAIQIPQFYLYISASFGGLLYLYREILGVIRHLRTNFFERPNGKRSSATGG
ncbi:MAG: TRAP transporter small permease [Syntrophaceae bacterium]|nr:TRAP transporter small permease [Syntrophaceae bacterium]